MMPEVTLLWILVLVQMAVMTVVIRELRRSPRAGLSPERPGLEGALVGRTLNVAAFATLRSPTIAGSVEGFLFVSAKCPTCESLLDALVLNPDRIATRLTVVAVGTPTTVDRMFGNRTRSLTFGLAAVERPSEVGVTRVPWLVVVDPEHRILADSGVGNLDVLAAVLHDPEQQHSQRAPASHPAIS